MKVIATVETNNATIRLPRGFLWTSCTLEATNFIAASGSFSNAVIAIDGIMSTELVVSNATTGTTVPCSFVLFNDKPGPQEDQTVCNAQPDMPMPSHLTIRLYSLAGLALTITDKFEMLLNFREP
jgi:hypothetical protein